MKYAIIMEAKTSKAKYLKGFTNEPIQEDKIDCVLYTVELKENKDLFILLEGHNAQALSQ